MRRAEDFGYKHEEQSDRQSASSSRPISSVIRRASVRPIGAYCACCQRRMAFIHARRIRTARPHTRRCVNRPRRPPWPALLQDGPSNQRCMGWRPTRSEAEPRRAIEASCSWRGAVGLLSRRIGGAARARPQCERALPCTNTFLRASIAVAIKESMPSGVAHLLTMPSSSRRIPTRLQKARRQRRCWKAIVSSMALALIC